MKITPKNTRLTLRTSMGTLVDAIRKDDHQWSLQKAGEDRKDTFSEAVLQKAIYDGKMHVERVFSTETITIETYAIGALGELMTAPSVKQLLDAGLLHIDVAELTKGFEFTQQMQAGPDGIPLDLIESCQEITVLAAEGKHSIYFVRESLDDMFAYSAKPLPKDTFTLNRANNRHVAEMTANREFTVKQFPQREFYDHLSVRYAELCKQVSQSSQSVSALERDLGAARGLYNKQCDEREALYARMVALGQ